MPPILPRGKEDFELVCARTFCPWRLGSVCRSLHLSKKKAPWWAKKPPRLCCLSMSIYLGSRSLQAQEHCWNKTRADMPLLPSAAAVVHRLLTCWCVRSAQPITCLYWGMQTASQSAVRWKGGPQVIQIRWQELKLRFYGHGSFHSQRWFYFATLLLVDTALLFYALEKI